MNEASEVGHPLIACHECDLLQRPPAVPGARRLRCARCGGLLLQSGHDVVSVPLALGLTASILFVVSNLYPMLDFAIQGQRESTYLLAGIYQLSVQGMHLLAAVVLLTTFVAPLLHIALLIYIFLPLALGARPPHFVIALRLVQWVLPWSMLEIFLLSVLVAAVKLASMATIVPGTAAWSLAALVLVLAAAATQVHPHRLWERVG